MENKVQIVLKGVLLESFLLEFNIINKFTNTFTKIDSEGNNIERSGINPVDTTLIIAGITSLVSLINSIFIYISNRKNGIVRIISSTGRILEFTKDTPAEKIQNYIDIIKQLDNIGKIVISGQSKRKGE